MSNSSLRKRLGIQDSSYPIASKIIKDAINDGLVKHYSELTSKKSAKYVLTGLNFCKRDVTHDSKMLSFAGENISY